MTMQGIKCAHLDSESNIMAEQPDNVPCLSYISLMCVLLRPQH